MSRRLIATLPAALLLAALPASAHASSRLYVRGHGFGHGVGMSQWGAYGYALHHRDYDAILRHYYRHTGLGSTNPAQDVRVLLQDDEHAVRVRGANRAGTRHVSPRRTYRIVRHGATSVELQTRRGHHVATLPAPLRLTGPGTLQLGGKAENGVSNGRYRGAIEVRPETFSGVDAINDVDLEDYVRGVVSAESPASWPEEALKAQAVAARTYAITTDVGGNGYEQYADTRSQMYKGVAAEYPSTDEAVAATRGRVVTYRGDPVTTYFFSTSGGQTEDVQNSFLGADPEPYLVSVRDPYDKYSPEHTWGPQRASIGSLGGWVKGRFKRIRVRQRGDSPRIVSADVVGSRGRTRVTGPELRSRLNLEDTWAYFTVISTRRHKAHRHHGAKAARVSRARATLAGHVRTPSAGRKTVEVQRREGSGWVAVSGARTGRHGGYRVQVEEPGRYRVSYSGLPGPTIRVR